MRVVLSLEIGPDGLPTGIADGGGVAECQFLDFAGNVVAYAGNDCPDRFDVDSEGLSWTRGLIHIERAFDLPWLGAPDFSPNGAQLVAERYLPSDDPLAAPLWGVVVYDIASRTQWDLVEGAAQPAWRPDTPADPLALRQARQGEFVVTLQPPLRLDGHEYTVSYLTTGALRQDSARLLALFTAEYLEQQQITALVVSEDGAKTVTDPELLRRIFSRSTRQLTVFTTAPPSRSTRFEKRRRC